MQATPCADGCQQNPPGVPDACRAAGGDPCARADAGSGLYCGSTLGAGDPETLYDCQGRVTASSRRCAAGCLQNPPGVPDACAPEGPADPCQGADGGDGAYCGASLGAGERDTLYQCRGRATVSSMPCPGGCQQNPPGVADACRAAADPCQGANGGDGPYCGSSLGAGDPNTLYDCRGRVTRSSMPCPGGCQQNPPGVADACRAAADPCQGANGGDGAYCGSSLGAGERETLYECRGRVTVGSMACPDGCQQNPPGVADACRAPAPAGDPCDAAAAGDGAYCGQSLGAGDPDTLYECRGRDVASSTPCAEGCRPSPPGVPDACRRGDGDCCLDRPPGALTQRFTACGLGGQHHGIDLGTRVGTPIYAGMAGTVIASRLGLPNCYDNGCSPACWNAFNYVKLRADCGDPNDPNRDLLIWYLHIDDLAPGIRNGAHVEQGQLLAYSGNSGCSSGPHIHLETASVPRGGDSALNTCSSSDPAARYCP
ncbi:MAG: M23 family metallopeptidase [bacterium]